MDDARILEALEIYQRQRDHRISALGRDPVPERAGDLNPHRPGAVRTRRVDDRRQHPASQLPLHEGQRDRVNASSGVQGLAGDESHAMGCRGGGSGIGPVHVCSVAAVEECLFPLEFSDEPGNPGCAQAGARGDLRG